MEFDRATRTDFWNDPDRWEGIDPHKECFWMKRHVDVIDVRSYTESTNKWTLIDRLRYHDP